MKIVYQCEACTEVYDSKLFIFNCIECESETCECCMHGYATCKKCAIGKTEEFLKDRFYEKYG